MEKNYDFETKMLRKPLRKTSQNGDHCTVKTFKEAKSHWLPLLLTVALSLLMGQTWAQNTVTVGPIKLEGSTWTVPAGTTSITFEAIGGGGRGGNANSTRTGCGGGGGGAYAQWTSNNSNDIFAGTVYEITVGKGGNQTTKDGTNSIVKKRGSSSNSLVAVGGKAPRNDNNTNAGTGGAAASCIPQTGAYSGGGGGTGASSITESRNRSGGGGGAAGPSQNGENGGNASSDRYGSAGTAGTGRDPGGDGGAGVGYQNVGNSGAEYGGGGSGAARGNNGSYTGGDGADGVVFVTYTYETRTITLDKNAVDAVAGKLTSFVALYQGEYGSPINSALYKPTREGWEFLGWFTQDTGGDKVESITICNSATNVTLYAHWKQYTDEDHLVKGMQTFTSNNNNWRVPEGTWKITNIEAWGGGGAGGGSSRSGSTGNRIYNYGGGGGSGAYAQNSILTPQDFHNSTFNITVGAAGTTVQSGSNGRAGGESSVRFNNNYYVIAGGGSGGSVVNRTNGGGGGAGGAANSTNGSVVVQGNDGGAVTSSAAGDGADAPNGGAGGAGANSNGNGQPGTVPGGGGGGAVTTDGSNRTGGAGAAGFVAIEYEILKLKVSRDLNYTDCPNPEDTNVLYYTNYDLGTPSRAGYVFKGWYNAQTGGTQFATRGTYSYTNDTTLYARWEMYPGKIANGSVTVLPCSKFTVEQDSAASLQGSTYRWFYTNNNTNHFIEGAQGESLTDFSLTELGTYVFHRVALNATTGDSVVSRGAYTVTVRSINGGTISAPSEIISRADYTISVSNSEAGVTNYKWGYKTQGESEYTIIPGATGATLTQANFALVAPGTYNIVRYTYIPDCSEAASTVATITVKLDGDKACFTTVDNISHNWIAPEGTYKITIEAWGGGGAGGNATNNRSVGSGGGGGGYILKELSKQNFHANAIAYTVGRGGSNGQNPTDGNDSKVTYNGATYTAGGGKKGSMEIAPSSNGTNTAQGGEGGTGDVDGSQGGSASVQRSGQNWNPTYTISASGVGGKAGGEQGGAGGTDVANRNESGAPGTAPGGGGSGARNANNSTSTNYGGTGGDGRVCISYEILELQLTTNVNHDDAVSQSEMVLYYDTLPVANPTRPGYVFLGWYDAPTGGNKVVFDSTANKTHALYNYDTDLNLYAQWEMDPGEIATDDTTILPCGTFSVAQVAPAKDGATYKWFYTNNNTDQFIDVTQNNITDFSLTEPGTYVFHRVALNAATGDSVVSRGAYTVTVRSINGGTITANPDTIAPRNGYTITSEIAEEGETIAYHWAYKKPGESTYTEISGAEDKDLTNAPVLSAIGTYVFIRYTDLTNCNCDSGTATTSITVALESHKVCFDPGDTTWTAPEGTWKVSIEAWGGGGAGGGAYRGGNVGNRTYNYGGGGGSGAYAANTITAQNFHGKPFSITVGAGGTGNSGSSAQAAKGGDGGSSSLSYNNETYVNAGGGKGGSVSSSDNNTLGAGGTAETGATKENGSNGANRTSNAGGKGGDAPHGGGTGGAGSTTNVNGSNGNSPGAGGGGAYCNTSNYNSCSGGAGGHGQVCLTYEILELQVVMNVNYGDAVNDTNLVLYYDTLPAPPTREGYEFAGWYDAPTDGSLVVFDSIGDYALYNKTEDMMLYAGWRIAPGEIETDTITILPCGNFSVAEVTPAMEGSAYKWFYTKDGGDSQFITGATAATLSQDNISLTEVGTYEFHRVALNLGDSVVSHGAYTVNVFLNGGVVAAIPATTVPRANYSVMSAVAEAGANITYQWKYKKAGDAEYTVIPDATSKDLTNGPTLVDLGAYQFIRYTYLAGCGANTIEAASEPVTITVQTSYVVCFDTPGEMTTWTAPVGTWKITSLQLWGGGAAGGDATNLYSVGSGGGGGAYLNTSMEYQNFHATPFNIKVANGADVHNDGDSSIVEFGNQTFKAKGGTKGEMASAVIMEGDEGTQTITAANGVGGEASPTGDQGGNATGTVTAKTVSTNYYITYLNSYTISASGAGGAGANGGAGGAALNNSTNGAGNPGTFPGGGGGGARNGSGEGNATYLGGTGASGKVCISYEIRDFKVVTDANYGGEHQYDTNYILYYDVVDLPTPTRTGFVFTGWYDDNGSQIVFDSVDNQAYYNFVRDTVLYAHWKVDAGTIGINDGRQYICSNEQYTIFGDEPEASNITYSWECTRWYDDASQNRTSQSFTIDTNRSYITQRDFPITEQGLYVFTRFVQTSDDTLGPQPSANQFKIYVVEPIDTVGGLTSNYGLICEGGKVTLTPDWDKAKIKIPNADDPTSDTSLAAIDVNYEYTADDGTTWLPYDPETTELTEGTPLLRAVFSYQSLDCKAYSKSIEVIIVNDPAFLSAPSASITEDESICPNGTVKLTAGELTNVESYIEQYPLNYIWKVFDNVSSEYVDVADEATYSYEGNGKVVNVSNFVLPGNAFDQGDDMSYVLYAVVVENELGCNANSYDLPIYDPEMFGDVQLNINNISSPTVTTHVTCPDAGGTYNLKNNVSDGGNLLWYADFTTDEAAEDESRLTYSLANEGTYVWYVANKGVEEGCNSARVPDSLVVRYTAHIDLTSSPALLTQDTCQYEDIKPITFAFDGDAVPEVVGTLPAGVHAVADASTHTYTISGAPTEVGEFDFKVRLQNTDCSQPTEFTCRLTVHYSPRTTVYFTSCNHEDKTIGEGADAHTFNSPGTYQVRLSSVLGCDSVVTLIYNDYDYNQFGYQDENEVLANWSDFSNVNSPISSGITGVYCGNNSQITYDDWSYSWSYTYGIIIELPHRISSDITSGNNFKGGNNGSLSLPSPGANGESGRTAGTSNGKSIVLKTKTKDYGQLSLQMDYQTSSASGTSNQSFSVITIEYSTDGNQWSGSGIEVQELPKTEGGGTTTGTLTIPNLPMAMNDKDELYIRLTFDGAATAVEQYSENQPLLLDNITFSGHKGITDVRLVEYPSDVCKNHLATIVASEPYVECDEDSTLCDTAMVYYHWTKTVGETTTELEELGNILVVPVTEAATYTVKVGTEENCHSSESCNISVLEPIDYYDVLVRTQSWCANDLDNFVFTDSELGEVVPGARISYPSIDSLSKAPGVYDCQLSIPSDVACDSIIHLVLTVLKSYDTTIYANICLGDSYVEYGFNESPDSVGSYTVTHSGHCSTGCDSIVTLHLTVNSVEHTLTSYDDVLMVAWPLNGGPKKLTPQCGEESVMRSAVLTFEGPNGFKAITAEEGSTLSSAVCPAATNSAIALYNGIGKSHYALEAEAWTSLESTSVLVKLNPTDYEPLKLSFDYNKSIDPDNAQYTNVQNSFTKVSCYYSYGDGNFVRLGNDVNLQTGTIENNRSTWQNIEFDLSRLHTLDSAELDIKLVFTGGNKGAGQTTTYGGYIRYRYFPAYLNIDNLVVIGDKPARAKLLANVPYASYVAPGELASSMAHSGDTVSICRDKSITFTSQKDDAYFKFFLEYPDDTEYPFSGSTTMTIEPQVNGYYKIIARDNNGCDSVFKFYVLVNDHPNITDCEAPGICTDARFAFVPSGADPSFTYSWPAPNCTDIDNSTLKLGDHQDSLRAQLHNLTDETVTITYTLTPYMGGCRGNDFDVKFKVYPEVQSSVIAPVVLDVCPGRQVLDTIQYSNVRSALNRQIVWELDGTKDTVLCSDQSGNTFKQAGVITLPATPCDTTYKVYATYTDSARCIAKDTITLTVNIPAHEFTIADADADSIVYCLNHATEPDTSLVPEAYSGCGDTLKGVLVGTYVDSPTDITCEGTRTYTYKYTDCKGQDTTWDYVYKISHKAPELKPDSVWPVDIEGQNKLYADRDTSVLYSDDQVKALYQDNCGGDALTVTHIQVDSSIENSGWKTIRIYTVVTACQDTVLPTMSVSGSDQTPPTPPSPESDPRVPIVDINCCMDAAFSTKPFDPTYAVLGYTDNDGGTVTAVKTDSTITGDNCSWTITYTYKVVDACGNELSGQTYTVSGSDQTAPVLITEGSWPSNRDNINASILEIPAASTKDAIKALFTDCSNVINVDSTRNVTGNDCDWTAKFCYEIKDQCNNTAFDTITFTGGDNIKPTYDHPADTTVYLSRYGEVDTNATTAGLGVPTNVLDNSGKTPAVSHIDTKTDSCGISYSFDRTWHVKDSCGNDSVYVQKIEVKDTITPVVTTTVAEANAFRTIDGAYNLPNAFTTITDARVTVTGINIDPELEMTEIDTFNKNTCGLYVVRTYTVRDTCNDSTATFTHKILVKDTLTPRINGTWKNDTVYLTNVCGYTLPDTLKTVADVNAQKADFIKGLNLNPAITMTQDTTDKDGCGMFITRTYTVTDSCSGNSAKFTHKIVVKDTLTPSIAGNWEDSTVNMDVAGHYELPTKFTSVAALNAMRADFIQNCNINDHIELVSADTTGEGTCGLKVTRTYQVTDSCSSKSNTFTHTITVADTVKPVIAALTWADDTVYLKIDTTYELPTAFETIGDVNGKEANFITGNNLDPNLTMVADTQNRNTCGLQVVRTYTVRDTCNDSTATFTHTIVVKDTLTPAINGTWGDSTVYLTEDGTYTLPAAYATVAQLNELKPNFIKGPNLNAAVTFEADTNDDNSCALYVVRTYTITDSCSHKSDTFKHKINVSDTITPRIISNWAASTINMDAAGHYTLPAAFATVSEINTAYGSAFIKGNNLRAAVTMVADTQNRNTCGLQVLRTYTVTDSCNDKTNTFTHTITVADTVKPVIADLTWDDDTVYLKIDTTYELPTEFVTIGDVNGEVANFITGNNLDPNLTMVADTQNRNTCGLQVVRTYTVRDTCNDKDSSFTHTIVVKDTLTPAINGTLGDSTVYLSAACGYTLPNAFTTVSQLNTLNPNFISGPNIVENITLKEADTNAVGTCDWNVVRTYEVTDSCSNKTKSFTHTINVKDTIAPVLAEGKVWLKDSLNQNELFADAYTAPLADDDSVKKLFHDCTELMVTHKDDTVLSSNCGWKIRRTYTITDNCGNKKVDSVFIGGGDQTKPTFTCPKDTILYLSDNCQVDTTPASTLVPTALADNSGVTPTFTHTNEAPVSDCGNTYYFYRVWKVTDACGNDSIQKQKITVKDSTRPAIAGTLTNDTVYLTDHSCSDYVLTAAMTTVGEVVDHSGDLTITDCNVSAATEVTAAEPATEYGQGTCDHYYVRTYTVKDSCNNSSTFTHKIVVMDTLTPSIAGNWTDSTVNMDAAGHYDLPAEFTSVAALNAMSENFIQNCNINDNIELVSADTTGEGTCGLQVTRTYQVTDSCSGKSKTFTHTITVGDTVKPVIQCKDVARSSYTNVGSDTYTKDSDSWNVTASDNNAIDTIYYNLSGATEGEGANTLNGVTFKTGMTLVTWTVKDVCGNDTTCTDTIKIINVNPITVYLSENSDTLVYDGQEHTLTGYVVDSISNDLYTDADFSLKASAINDTIVKGTLAGSYSMPLDNEDFENVSPYFKNIHFNVTSRDLVIKQNPAVITIASGSHTFDASEYDGQPHYFPSYVVKYNGETMPRTAQDSTKFVLPAGDTLSVTPTGYVIDARETAEHNNTFTWELQHADCYANEIDTNGLVGTIHFNAFPQPIVISSETMTWTYDGNAHSYPKYTVKFGDEYATRFEADTTKFILPITGDTVRIHSTASITDAGKVANTFTYTIDNDVIYVGERDTIVDTLYVLPLTGVVVTITENTDTVTYDGTPHSVTGYEVTNISSNLYHVANFTYNGQVADTTASGTYAGTYPMNVLSTQFANTNSNFSGVTFTIVDQDLVINPIQSNIQITAKSAEKNFDGTPLTEAGYTHTMNGNLVAGDTIVATVVGSRTAVGSSDNVVTAYYVLRKTSATTFDTITNCYTFADPATVNGTLRVNKALAIVSKDSVDVDCYGNHNGTATIVVEGGKLVNDKYEYTVAGPNSYSVIDSIGTTLELTGLYPGAYTVTFNDGLDSTLTATFSINEPDTLVAEITAPNALCPNQGSYRVSVTVNGGNGTNAYVWGSNATNVNATSTVVAQISASDCGTEYTAAVKVTDAKGCVAKDTVKFTVDDNEAPTFTAPADITLCRNVDGQIEAPISVTGVPTGYSDNCSNEATMIRHTTFRDIDTTGTLNMLMVIRREWTVTDSCGNSVADTQRISIKPSIAGSDYVLTAPADIEVTLLYGAVDTLIANIGQATASHIPDGIATPEITNNKPENDRYPEGINYVVWTATDECGFTVVDTQTIIVNYPPCDPVTYYGYEYPAVRIGGNCWLAENLRNTQYADQVNVPNYSSYNNDGNMTDNYGLLYSWYSAVRVPEGNDNAVPSTMEDVSGGYVQGLCPDGWALPKQTDYNALMTAVGTTDVLKDVNVQFWLPGAAGATPSTGFNARGAGYYDASVDRYMNILGEAYFWTSDAGATVTAGMCSVITHYCPELINYNQNKNMGFSVRCIRKKL